MLFQTDDLFLDSVFRKALQMHVERGEDPQPLGVEGRDRKVVSELLFDEVDEVGRRGQVLQSLFLRQGPADGLVIICFIDAVVF
ncbi:MAG: hypothetical protein ACD_62C00275G0004 [uncultured bacterium]|nr:MAG: hypothetical protein ACD_62C00275G0004 [uncultured bacterium]